jgi:hypothetical protein
MFPSRAHSIMRALTASLLLLGFFMLPTRDVQAQDELSRAFNLQDRRAYDELVDEARSVRARGDYREALSRYEAAYKKGLEVAREGGFGSRRMVIPIDIQRGRTIDMMVPRGKEELSPLIEEAARVAVLADQPETVLYWLRKDGFHAYLSSRDVQYPDDLDVSRRLRGDRLSLLRQLIDLANERGIEHTARQLLTEQERHQKIVDFENAFWRQKRNEARHRVFTVLLIGLLVLAGLILWFSSPNLLFSRIHWSSKPHKRYRRYAPKEPFRWPTLLNIVRYPKSISQLYEMLPWGLLMLFLSGLGFVMAGFFMHQLWERPLKEPFLRMGLTWLFGGLGLLMFGLMFFDRRCSPSVGPLVKFLGPSRAEHLLPDFERMQQDRLAICQQHKIPGVFTRWRSMESVTIGSFESLSGQGTVRRVLVGLFIADHLRRGRHAVPPQFELWIREGLNNGLLVHFEEAMDDYLDLIPVPERSRWFREFPFLQSRIEGAITPGTPDLERLEEELEVYLKNGRRWGVAKWRERFLRQDLYASFRHSIIWGAYDREGRLLKTFRVEDELTFVEAEMDEVDLVHLAPFEIGLAHPGEWSMQEKMAWAQHMADFELIMVCSQLDREPVALSLAASRQDPEVFSTGFDISEAKVQHMNEEGWRQFRNATHFERLFSSYRCLVHVETDLGAIRFFDAHNFQRTLEVSSIHPAALSEILYTLRAINARD